VVVEWNKDENSPARACAAGQAQRCDRRSARLLLEDHHHGDVEGARGVVANLNVGVEERHVAEPLAERDALMDDAEHIGRVRVRYYYYHHHYEGAAAAVVWGALRRFLSCSVWKKNQVVCCISISISISMISNGASGAFAPASSSYLFIIIISSERA
jgi:hypothetical protein